MIRMDYSAVSPDAEHSWSLAQNVKPSLEQNKAMLALVQERIEAGIYPVGTAVAGRPVNAKVVDAQRALFAGRPHDRAELVEVMNGAPRPDRSGMTVRDLFNDLAGLMNMDAGDDLVFVESHGMSSPLLYTEPGDGLENLTLIGAELETPATPRISRRRARARYLLHNEPKCPDPSR